MKNTTREFQFQILQNAKQPQIIFSNFVFPCVSFPKESNSNRAFKEASSVLVSGQDKAGTGSTLKAHILKSSTKINQPNHRSFIGANLINFISNS